MAVVGQVGSGKSSLLSAMLGEMEVVTGATHVNVSLMLSVGIRINIISLSLNIIH